MAVSTRYKQPELHVRLGLQWEPIVFDPATRETVAEFRCTEMAWRAARLLETFRTECGQSGRLGSYRYHDWATTRDGDRVCFRCGHKQ